MDAQEFRSLQEAYLEVVENQQLDEAEGSYGQTPRARKSYADLANKRRATPASGFAKRGEKTKKVKSAERHFNRTGNPDAGNRGKKSTKPSFNSGGRKGMTQKDRDYSRGEAEYGHTGYDPDFDGGPSAPGGKPKGKKLERQRKTGVSAESMEVVANEGYKKLPTDKMARQAFKKNLKATKDSIKTRFTTAPQSTARNVDVAKANKKLSQAKKIMDVRDKTHVPSEVKSKEAKNRKTDYLSLVKDKYSEQVDLYDIILSHLLDEGYADTPEAAEAIMVNMSEEWRQSIVG